jgi:hypothetical protein
MTNTRLGYLQKQMVSFMRKSIDLYGPAISRAFHIHSDAESILIGSFLFGVGIALRAPIVIILGVAVMFFGSK